MAVTIDTATSHTDLFAALRTFLKASTGSGGAGWTELDYDGTAKKMLLQAPGLAGGEEINFGFSLHSHVGDDAYSIGGWMFQAYDAGLDFLTQPGTSAVSYHMLWDQSMPYWFVANGRCMKLITKVSTVYPASYVGKILPRSLPGDYPLPYYIGMQSIASNTRWSTTSENNRNFFDPGEGCRILTPGRQWANVQNFQEQSGESPVSSSISSWPYTAQSLSTASPQSRWRELRENLDGSYPLFPIELMGNTPGIEIYGELDGVFAVPGFGAATEDTIDIGGDDHLFLQNLYRTARYYYSAVRLA